MTTRDDNLAACNHLHADFVKDLFDREMEVATLRGYGFPKASVEPEPLPTFEEITVRLETIRVRMLELSQERQRLWDRQRAQQPTDSDILRGLVG